MPFDSAELVLENAKNRNVYATCIDIQQKSQINNNHLGYSSLNNQSNNNNSNGMAVIGAEDGLAHTLNINSAK
jgi:hypothetical protein